MKVCDDVRDKMICKGTNGERAIQLCTQYHYWPPLLHMGPSPCLDAGSHSMWQQPLHLVQDEYELGDRFENTESDTVQNAYDVLCTIMSARPAKQEAR